MAHHAFFIPAHRDFWNLPAEEAGKDVTRWIEAEVERARKIAERLFPDVAFFICEEPPPSQTYERGSINQEIRQVLESRSGVSFGSRVRRRL